MKDSQSNDKILLIEESTNKLAQLPKLRNTASIEVVVGGTSTENKLKINGKARTQIKSQVHRSSGAQSTTTKDAIKKLTFDGRGLESI